MEVCVKPNLYKLSSSCCISRLGENWNVMFTGLIAFGTVVGTVFYMEDQAKHSDRRKYNVVRDAMLQPVPIEPLEYPELYAKDQVDMMHRLIFSKEARLALVEGAQGIA